MSLNAIDLSINNLRDMSLNAIDLINNLRDMSLNAIDLSINNLRDMSLNAIDLSINNLRDMSLNAIDLSINNLKEVIKLNNSGKKSVLNSSHNDDSQLNFVVKQVQQHLHLIQT